jgi:hypothetical protein
MQLERRIFVYILQNVSWKLPLFKASLWRYNFIWITCIREHMFSSQCRHLHHGLEASRLFASEGKGGRTAHASHTAITMTVAIKQMAFWRLFTEHGHLFGWEKNVLETVQPKWFYFLCFSYLCCSVTLSILSFCLYSFMPFTHFKSWKHQL